MIQGFVLALTLVAQATATAPLAPGTKYDPKIPTVRQVLGYEFGEEITPPEQLVAYMLTL